MKRTMALITYILLLAFLNVILGEECVINNVPERIAWEKQLRKDLKCNYHMYDPPGVNSSTIPVNIRFIMKYFNLNSKDEVFTIQTWTFVSWTDERLKWDPEKYFGINETEISSVYLWTPSFRLFNSADSNDFDRYFYVRCTVKSTGHVLCVPKIIHAAMCSVKLKDWPYDVQECSLEYGAGASKWINVTMNFTSRAISMLGAEYGAEWFISDYKQEENPSSEKQLKMTFGLEREAAGLAAIVVYPSVILTALSITCIFLDVRLNVRLSFACYILIGHYYFLIELAQEIPKKSADPPNLLLYYRGSVVLTVMTIFLTFILDAICKLKSTPQNYIISINDFVFESYGKYLVFPRWNIDDVMIDSKLFNEDWTKFANIINSVFILIIIVAYISLYGSLMPKPVPINY